MNTQCPHCRTIFRIQQEQLDAAAGRVRCGYCRVVFDARQRLQKELPFTRTASAGQGALQLGQPRAAVSGVLLSDLGGDRAEGPRRSGWSIAAWSVFNALLVVLLLGQIVYAQREAFAQDPTMRPLLVQMCNPIGCTLPPRRAVDRIELVRRSVYAHPNAADALIIDATFVNNARFAQPHPVLTVTLGDVRGEPLIRRNFQPQEYLPELDRNQRMAPGARTFEFGFS